MAAPAVLFRHHTIAGLVHDPITKVPDDTWGDVTGTITSRRTYGKGVGLRVVLAVTDDRGATVVATLDADRLRHIPPFLTARDARVQVRGLVRRLDGMPPTITAAGIAPADA
ncbi:hypothetical protein [Streptomyces sp. 5-6(2022)]|uniref:hypothetical protein n=1 Tax=Streptomyces sp. 5-6(2022) TaxID=2936510 RepID=UPI0023B8A54D|nr:hypothetical protein [Streptomyces sp. 5-6(2022)]